ncbi:ribonuclease catalytic domain-containing protein [Ottowia sp.]|uniref:ribonuclease catalytic domain-containing protein n=1 Tax=Ottowia sp. TaxID=1898956 RepID=UPI0025D496E6|nr:ribonuclease catalytic domain-containing protein [Ottowia sp.]MBK6614480.1 RNB domain-containing ribonuclease [Ottowia sp.]MBK6744962.1 RNB domain-containing ribonuclease [Ottowia sp.]
MHVLFDEAGKFLAGRILSEADASAQVELDSGKRLKVKAANQLLRFDKPAPAELLAQAQAQAAEIDPALAWEFAPEDEFGFAVLARDYFGDAPTVAQQAAALIALHEAPHYFRRAGKGRFRKAPADVVAQALAAIEKKKQIAAQIAAWADELAQGQCPAPIREQLYKILFRPDKNAPEYKAVVEAARATQQAPLALLTRAGAIASAYQFHWQRFLFENFPKGTGFPALQAPAIAEELPLADVQAYSIDDSQTTEIDDALSLRGLGTGTVVLGIHIAAPGLAIQPGDALDELGRARLSTVYMPGYKITMLPDEVVQAYTLSEGRAAPAVSLYVTLDEASLEIQASETRLERVPIAANLRHDQLDALVTAEWLEGGEDLNENELQPPTIQREQLSFLYRLARHLKARREQVRGKPETFNRPDYNFRLAGHDGGVPTGDEQVAITTRQRGAPLDLIVAEAMILANSTWGQWLASLGVPAIYRSQASLAPGVKVRMGAKALPHAGIGVPSYAWSTSPLRRYVDLVNQWQIIACARHGKTAALAAPFKPRDAQLFAIISAFDAAYTAYNGHQASMERFWTLQYLRQHGITELTASLIKEQPGGAWLVRADDLPLVFTVLGAQGLPRGTRVRVKLGEIDAIALDVRGTVLDVLQAEPVGVGAPAPTPDEDDEESAAGPLTIAVDVGEAEGASADNPAP